MSLDFINANDIIDHMIDLRIQMAQLQQEIEALHPSFCAACVTFDKPTIQLERAIIKRRFTPGKWLYDEEITTQANLLKTLKAQFKIDHEPIAGRDINWIIQLLLGQS